MLRIFLATALLASVATFSAAPALAAEKPLPDRRMLTSINKDFPGNDIGTIFDTSWTNCRRKCMANKSCKALTYNRKAKSCFLKSTVERSERFDGAFSAEMIETPAIDQIRAKRRMKELGFLKTWMIRSARELAANMGGRVAANDHPAATHRRNARNSEAGLDLKRAAQQFRAAITVDDDARDWLNLARILMKTDEKNRSKRRNLRQEARSAAINALLRARSDDTAANAAYMLGDALEATGQGRSMINALQLAQKLVPSRKTAERLNYAIGRYGFRVTGHRVESDPAQARMCVTFSEPLAEAGTDYAPYVAVAGQDNLPVEAKGKELCIDGLEHGRRYQLTVRDGLPSKAGERTRRAARIEAYVKDRSPTVRFAGKAYVLPKSATASIPIVTVNLDKVAISIHRIGERNLVPRLVGDSIDGALNRYAENAIKDNTGEKVWSGTADVQSRVNADVTTALPIGEAVQGFKPGIYVMTARVPGDTDQWEKKATQWFIVTDLGIATMKGSDGFHVFVRLLSTAGAVEGATVKLVARNNEVLGTATSDARGYVHFAPGLVRGKGGMAPAMAMVEQDGDFAFLNVAKAAFDLSDRGVSGRSAPGPIDVFVTTERGVYRPGEVVHITALARDGQAQAIPHLPLTAVLTRPDGVEYHRVLLQDKGAGGFSHSVRLGQGVARGTWNLRIYTDPKAAALKSYSFLVEDFVPQKITYDLTMPDGMVSRNADVSLKLNVRYLYGAKGAGLPVEGKVRLTASSELPGFKGFSWGLATEKFNTVTDALAGTTTDANGDATLKLTIPGAGSVTKPMDITAIVSVTGSSGRPVERTVTRPLAPGKQMIGIRPLFSGQAEEGGTARFEVVAVGPNGRQIALTNVGWTLSKIHRSWQWYEVDGNWRWEATTRRERVANGNVELTSDQRARIEAGVKWGSYELKLVDLDGGETAASYRFSAGWYAGGAGSDTPDMLEVGLDRKKYAIGDRVELRLKPRYAGKVLVSVVDNRLIEMKTVDVAAGETTVDLTVTEAWGPGAYITATLIQPMDVANRRNPSRALGLAWASVDPGERKLNLSFTTPDQVNPRGPLDASVRLTGLPPGEAAYVTVAAVDLGILNLTAFKPPAPDKHYFGKRSLGMEMRDVYGQLIDGLQGAPGRLRSGGDAEGARLKSIPPVEHLVAYYSGVVEVGADGIAKVTFEVPDFNGTVRLMAMAWTSTAVGHASKDVLVRDPIVVSAATPRFLAPGDRTRLQLDLAHASGAEGDVTVKVETTGGVTVGDGGAATINLSRDQIRRVTLQMAAFEIGNHAITIRTTTPSGQELVKRLTMGVRLLDPVVSRRNRISLPTGGKLVVNAATFAGYEIGTGRATLGVGPAAQFDAPGLLRELDRYPYGCTEQTTSRALPLLYLDEVARAMGMAKRRKIADRVNKAIARVLENQASGGSFGLWRPDSGDLWLDAYVSDFLSRAKAKGYKVPKIAFKSALDNLRSSLSYASDFKKGGEGVAYALMVLAREGAASIGDLRYFADAKAANFSTPLAKAQLGAALASYGEQRRADMMFRMAADDVLKGHDSFTGWRSDYGSYLRDGAAVVALAAEARSGAVNAQHLVTLLAEKRKRYTSTQEKVWMLMATHALINQVSEGLLINGQPVQGPLIRMLDQAAVAGGDIVIENRGPATSAVLTTFGVPLSPEPAGGTGYQIKRTYYTMDGTAVSPSSVKQNDRLVVVLTVTPKTNRRARLIVDDPLPAGFEIDNPRLAQSGSIAALSWLKALDTVASAQFRTERFVAAVNHKGTKAFRLAYIVRAISPGKFHHPAAIVEDMYRPAFRAWTGTGSVEVVEAR